LQKPPKLLEQLEPHCLQAFHLHQSQLYNQPPGTHHIHSSQKFQTPGLLQGIQYHQLEHQL
jgi:hypothetical protein